MRGQYVQITKIRYLCFDLVHSRYTRMAGFGRREIEYMQALCIYNIYIEYYSVMLTLRALLVFCPHVYMPAYIGLTRTCGPQKQQMIIVKMYLKILIYFWKHYIFPKRWKYFKKYCNNLLRYFIFIHEYILYISIISQQPPVWPLNLDFIFFPSGHSLPQPPPPPKPT